MGITPDKSDTPRTDAIVVGMPEYCGIDEITSGFNAMLSLARELERENTRLTAQLAEAQRNKVEQARHCQELTAQLIEARKDVGASLHALAAQECPQWPYMCLGPCKVCAAKRLVLAIASTGEAG